MREALRRVYAAAAAAAAATATTATATTATCIPGTDPSITRSPCSVYAVARRATGSGRRFKGEQACPPVLGAGRGGGPTATGGAGSGREALSTPTRLAGMTFPPSKVTAVVAVLSCRWWSQCEAERPGLSVFVVPTHGDIRRWCACARLRLGLNRAACTHARWNRGIYRTARTERRRRVCVYISGWKHAVCVCVLRDSRVCLH